MKKTIQTILAATILVLLANYSSAQCWNQNFTITSSVTQPCDHDGAVDITVTGGTAPYTYEWRWYGDPTILATTQDINGLHGGQYTVQVRDANNDCSTQWIQLSNPFQLQFSTTPDHCPAHDGSATVTVSGGNIPYAFLWSNGGTTTTISNLTAGNYDLTVTDAAGCKVIASEGDSASTGLTIYSQNNISLVLSVTNATCTINSGSVTVTSVTNGTAPYTYSWSDSWNGGGNTWTTQTVNNIPAGYYVVSVTDGNGCVASNYQYVEFISPITLNSTSTQENCNHADGTATIVANGTTPPYTYLWSTGGTTAAITGLVQGQYYVTVHDANGCENISSAYVSRYSPIQPNVTYTNEVCDNNSGTATATPTLGTAPYSYLWSNGATTASINSLNTGSYYVTITDNAGCTVTSGAYIQNTSPITPNETHVNQVCAVSLGSISLSPSGGSAPYSYLWSNGATTASLTSLTAGSYYYTITDAAGCVRNYGVGISLTSGINAYANTTANELCLSHNGSVTFSASGGAPPYTHLWSNGSGLTTLTNLSAGSYSVSITDQNGCVVVKSTTVYRNSPLAATISVTPATCIFTNDGSATVSLTGGTAPYNYNWGNGSNLATATGLHADWGIGLNVVDVNGCAAHAYKNSVGYTDLTCAAIIEGKVIDDANANCILDGVESGLQNTTVSAVPGYNRLTNATGNYQFIVPAGNYGITQYAEYRNQACPVGSILLNNCVAGTTYSNNDFFDQPLDVYDLRVSFDYITPPRPGFNHTIRVRYYNNGLHNATGQVEVVYDAGATYLSGASSVNTITHTATIDFANLQPVIGWGEAALVFSTPSSTALGTIQNYSAHVTPDVNDATPPNNTETLAVEVVGSYDPNDKNVTPKGTGIPGYITPADSFLKYVIRFQNTGSFTASFVAIKDTLDTDIDIRTIKPGAASHAYRMQIMDERTLVFLFDPIYLPDTVTNEPASHGMVTFYAKLKKNLANGTEIKNRAAIYFDFNEPVITNTTLNTISGATGIASISNDLKMQLLPNPTTGNANLILTLTENFTGKISVTNLLGEEMFQKNISLETGTSQVPVNVDGLANGVYLVRVSNETYSSTLRLIKQ